MRECEKMNEVLPIVMNSSFERLAVIDDYSSFIWTIRYYSAGDFELVVAASEKNKDLFRQDYFIVRDDDENVGIIEDIKIQHSAEGADTLAVTGRFLSSILDRRIIAVQTNVSGTISDCIDQLIDENVINPSIAARKIGGFVLGEYTISQTMEAQYTGKNLLETISAICETYRIGFKVTLNDQNEFVFMLYEGVDHTYSQNVRPYVIFSDRYDNLLSSEYEENYQNIATAVLVAGEGEGLERKTVWVSDGGVGLDRHEVYKDARSIRSNDGDIPDSEYYELLAEAGREDLTKYIAAFTGEVYFDKLNYRDDVNIGDLCVVENSRWGIYMTVRIVEIIESVSETGEHTIMPTFGV